MTPYCILTLSFVAFSLFGGELPADPGNDSLLDRAVILPPGRSPLRPEFTIEGYSNDNVFIGDDIQQDDFVWELVPEIIFESSRPEELRAHFFSFGYDPEILRYSKFTSLDALSHRGFARYQFRGNRFKTNLFYRSAEFSGTFREAEDALFDSVDLDVGRQALQGGLRQLTRIENEVDLSGKSIIETTAFLRSIEFESGSISPSEEWFASFFLMHQIAPKTELGVGPGFGEFLINSAPNHQIWNGLMQLRHAFSPKTGFQFIGGVDIREFETAAPTSSLETFIYDAGVDWEPTSFTKFSLSGYQRVNASVNGQSVFREGIAITLKQKVAKRWNYLLRSGLETKQYQDPVNVVFSRLDDYHYITNRIEYKIGEHSLVGLFHEYRLNESDLGNSFARNQAGISFSHKF